MIPTDKLTANNVRRALAELRGANVATIGGNYVAWIHPDVSSTGDVKPSLINGERCDANPQEPLGDLQRLSEKAA